MDEEYEEESEPSDGEDENEDITPKIDYKDEDWLENVSKKCQVCKKQFESCRDGKFLSALPLT
jgi:hypothetical protein